METGLEIMVCMGSSCFARGNQQNLRTIERFVEEHGLDARVKLCGSHCEDACAKGPNIWVNHERHSHVDEGALLDILRETLNMASET